MPFISKGKVVSKVSILFANVILICETYCPPKIPIAGTVVIHAPMLAMVDMRNDSSIVTASVVSLLLHVFLSR